MHKRNLRDFLTDDCEELSFIHNRPWKQMSQPNLFVHVIRGSLDPVETN